jgi:hypothetical protein
MAHLRFTIERRLRHSHAAPRSFPEAGQALSALASEGYVPVAAIISGALPRFRGMPDRAVLAAPFQLSDAQELVARKLGFEGWTALIQGAEPMPSPVENRPSMIVAAEPQLFVSDMRAALDFYTSKLGFAIAFAYGEPPFYAQVRRDGARLNLRLAGGPVFDESFRGRARRAVGDAGARRRQAAVPCL